MMIRHLAFITALAMALSVWSGCGKPTKEQKKSAYESVKAELNAIATNDPTRKAGIETALKGFDQQMAAAEKLEGDAKVKAMAAVVSAAEKFKETIAAGTGKTAGGAKTAPKPG